MAFKAVHIILDPPTREFSEILFAPLDANNYYGIFERDDIFIAYMASDLFSDEPLLEIQESLLALWFRMKWEIEDITDQNWNSLWECSYEPVIIDTRCAIRTSFHPEFPEVRYQITIEPKMAFGTGHHKTTRLMIEQMFELEFKQKEVLDMGCGTGILGILASMMGACKVVAIDIDNWAYQNTKENAAINQCHNISVIQGGINEIPEGAFDIILVNINRNILVSQMKDYTLHTHQKSILLISGILEEDRVAVKRHAEKEQFHLLKTQILDKWMVMMFERN